MEVKMVFAHADDISYQGKIFYKTMYFDGDDSFFIEKNLKPFDKVLVRKNKKDIWKPHFFREYNNFFCVFCIGDENYYDECISYEGNENLAFTNNDFEIEGDIIDD